MLPGLFFWSFVIFILCSLWVMVGGGGAYVSAADGAKLKLSSIFVFIETFTDIYINAVKNQFDHSLPPPPQKRRDFPSLFCFSGRISS